MLLLYNGTDPDSVKIARYYEQVHPGVHLLDLNVPDTDDISATEYFDVVRPEVLTALSSSISYIVTTKGLPLRIDNTPPASFPYIYTDALGTHDIYSSTDWSNYTSLEAALTRIESVDSNIQLGDQTWWSPTPCYCQNPYYQHESLFSSTNPATSGMFLTSRLDGYTAADVISEIKNAQNVTIKTGASQFIVDDSSAAAGKNQTTMGSLVNNVLIPAKQSYTYNTSATPVTTSPLPVVGYDSFGTNEGLQPGYIANQLDFSVGKGAVFESWESFNAYSYTPGVKVDGQGLLADWIAKGGAAAVGQVQEPGSGVTAITNEDIMYQMLLEGYNLAEAAWAATPRLDFVNTVLGDPLMTWNVTGLPANFVQPLTSADPSGPNGNLPEPGAGIVAISACSMLLRRRRSTLS